MVWSKPPLIIIINAAAAAASVRPLCLLRTQTNRDGPASASSDAPIIPDLDAPTTHTHE